MGRKLLDDKTGNCKEAGHQLPHKKKDKLWVILVFTLTVSKKKCCKKILLVKKKLAKEIENINV